MKTNKRIDLRKLAALVLLAMAIPTAAWSQTCQAAFTFTVGSSGQVSFSDASTGTTTVTTYYWNFGDGSGSQQPSPSHTYLYNGNYTASLYITDSLNGGGCSSTYTTVVSITNAATCNLSVNYTYTMTSNGQVNFTNTSTGINPGMIINWTFGDGSSSSQSSPSHSYTYNGGYGVNLSISDTLGLCVGNHYDTLVIDSAQNPPSCNTTFTYTLGSTGAVSFTGSQSGTLTQPQIMWDFGDGQQTHLTLTPSHTYAYNGTYYVYLYVTDSLNPSYGCNYYQAVTITNAANPCNDSLYFIVVPDTSQPGVWNVVLYSNDLNGITGATWMWGDGTSSSGVYPSHTYSTPGWYNICVAASFACGDSASYCQNDSVYRSSAQMITVHVINSQTGIHSNEEIMTSFKAYPNPFNDELTLNFTSYQNKVVACSMYDMMGNLVSSQSVAAINGDNVVKLKTADLAKGVYFIQMNTGGNRSGTFKVIK